MKAKRAAPRKTVPPAPIPRDRRPLAAAIALCALTLVAFGNSFQAGFPLDSKPLILEDARVHSATPEHIAQIFDHTYWWPRGESGLYRPLTTLSFLFNYAVLGDGEHPAGYHWINWLLHALNALLVYALARRMIRGFWPPVFAAGLWAVHPVLTESVTNIAGRADLMAAAAVLGGLLLYLKAADASGGFRFAWLAAMAAVVLAGVFSKENAVVVAGVIALFEFTWWRERGKRDALVAAGVALFVPFAILLARRSLVLRGTLPAEFPFTDNPIVGAGFWAGRLTALKVLARYLWLTVWPAHLSADYSYHQITLAHGSVGDWLAWITVAGAAAAVALLYRRNRPAFFLACFAFVTLLPVANLVMPIGTIIAERFLYLPSAGLVACLVLAVYWAAERMGAGRAAPIVLSVVALGFAVRTWVRNQDWQDDVTLAQATVAAAPDSFKSHQMLAEAWFLDDRDHKDLGSIIGQARKATAILDPLPPDRSTPEVYRLAGACYLLEGDRQRQKDQSGRMLLTAASVTEYREALPILQRGAAILDAARARQQAHLRARGQKPLFAPSVNDDLYRLLSVAYLRLGDGDRAFDAALEARNRDPLNPEVYGQMSEIYDAAGEREHAAVALMLGMLVTSDMGLRQELVDLYKQGPEGSGCAISSGPNGPAINPACPLVRRDLCDASVDAVKISVFTGRMNTARSLKGSFLKDYGCPAGPLNEALPD